MPVARTFSYDLHGLLGVRLCVRGCKWQARMLDAKLTAYASAPSEKADVEMHVGPFRPAVPADARVVDKDFHVAPDYIYFRGGRGGGATEIVGLEAPVTVIRHQPYPEAPPRWLARGLRGINLYLEPVIAWRLRRQGAFLFHAAAVSRAGKALALFGTNGAYKTRLALELCLRHGWSLLGDDLVVLHQGRVRSFVEHPAVLHARAGAVLAGGPPNACPARLAWDILRCRPQRCQALEIAAAAPLTGAVLLERTNRPDPAEVAPTAAKEVWQSAAALERLELNKHQRRHRQVTNFGRFLMAYEYAFPGSAIFRDLLLEDPTMPEYMNAPALRCRQGDRYDPDLTARLQTAWGDLTERT